MQLHYTRQGEGLPLIFLHGLFGSAENWKTIAAYFANQYEVICVDLRNHGHSPHTDSQTYPEMANDLQRLCDALDLDKIHLVGHSLGGKVAMQFSAQFPHSLRSLIVVDMAPRAYPDQHTALMEAMLAIPLAHFKSRSEVNAALTERIPDSMIRQFLLKNLVSDQGILRWRINLPALKANYPALLEAVCQQSLIRVPSLFMYGEFSDYVLAEDREAIQQQFSRVRFVSLPTQHWVHAEAPEQFTQALEQFLNCA